MGIWEKECFRGEGSRWKSPEAGACLSCSGNTEEAKAAGLSGWRPSHGEGWSCGLRRLVEGFRLDPECDRNIGKVAVLV